MTHGFCAYHQIIFLTTPYMVSLPPFCNRLTVFLLKTGYRYNTGFRFNISAGSPTEEGGYGGWPQGTKALGNGDRASSPSTLIQSIHPHPGHPPSPRHPHLNPALFKRILPPSTISDRANIRQQCRHHLMPSHHAGTNYLNSFR